MISKIGRWCVKIGIGAALLGSAPLLIFLLLHQIGFIKDPNPNPIGLGLLFMVTFAPGTCLAVFGGVLLGIERLRNKAG